MKTFRTITERFGRTGRATITITQYGTTVRKMIIGVDGCTNVKWTKI